MTAYVEQLRRSEKRVNLIEGSLQIGRLLLSNDQAHRRGLTSFLDLASGVVLLGILHVFLLLLIRFRTKWPRPIEALTLRVSMLLNCIAERVRRHLMRNAEPLAQSSWSSSTRFAVKRA